jgi:hypothetical protein
MEARYRRKAWPRLRYSEAAERYSEAPERHAGASEYCHPTHAFAVNTDIRFCRALVLPVNGDWSLAA